MALLSTTLVGVGRRCGRWLALALLFRCCPLGSRGVADYHFDHAGGAVPPQLVAMVYGPMGKPGGASLPGLGEMGRDHGAKLYCHALERERLAKQCSVELSELHPLEQGTRLPLGSAGSIEVLHTPGHSGGSVCLCVQDSGATQSLIVGDTIFPGSCGRVRVATGYPPPATRPQASTPRMCASQALARLATACEPPPPPLLFRAARPARLRQACHVPIAPEAAQPRRRDRHLSGPCVLRRAHDGRTGEAGRAAAPV